MTLLRFHYKARFRRQSGLLQSLLDNVAAIRSIHFALFSIAKNAERAAAS